MGRVVRGDARLEFLVLRLDPAWQPDWKQAAFQLKSLVVAIKTNGPGVRVGLQGSEAQVNALLAHELAPYIEGYVFEDDPFIPEADETGKLWQRLRVPETRVLGALVDAASLGIELVLLEGTPISAGHRTFLDTVGQTPTGSLDLQPDVFHMDQEAVVFFLDPQSGNYHLAVYATADSPQQLHFSLAEGLRVTPIYPEKAAYRARQFGKRTEITFPGGTPYYFFLLEPAVRSGNSESLRIVGKGRIDPYELVVRNQVFKDKQAQGFRSLQVDELSNFRYQIPAGPAFDITYKDTVIIRKGQPIERLRKELYFGGVKWRHETLPELPLIQPEKVQSVPLDIDLDKSYEYTYQGEDRLDGNRVWKVRFQPKDRGDFFSGTVWIDQQTGAHRKIRAIQSGLETPVIGNEITAFFDWVEDGDKRYWAQVREQNMQVISLVGERITLHIESRRENYRFNRTDLAKVLAAAYESNLTILRDTARGFRYLIKKKGERVLSENTFTSKKMLLGGVLFDPSLDTPIPLAGLNYTNLNFLKRGYQANFFIAGAVNDLIVSNADFLGKGWDFTAEVFLTALFFEDSVFENGEERDDLAVKSLRESLNLSLGIPLNSFFKISFNYGLRYLDYKEADDTDEAFILPNQTLEHIGRFNLEFSRARFVTELEYEWVSRTDWAVFGLPDNGEPVQERYRTLSFNAALSKRLPRFQNLSADLRYLKGWDLDRFSRFGFGFFENRVSGFGSSGIKGDEALRVRFSYEVGIKGLYELDLSLDGARAKLNNLLLDGIPIQEDTIDLVGVGLAINFLGPWKSLFRIDVGYGIHADLEGEDGNLSGQIVFLKLF